MNTIKAKYLHYCRYFYSIISAPTNSHIQLCLFVAGVALLTAGLVSGALAQVSDDGEVNAERINYAVQKIFK